MSTKKGKKSDNVRREYRQLIISGFEHLVQSRNENSDSEKDGKRDQETPIRGKGSYQVSVTFVIDQISDDSGEHVYRVLLNDDPDILIAPYSIRSKKVTGQAAHTPKKGIKGGDSLPLVYGVHADGKRTLSHPSQHPLQRAIPQIYSWLLGAIDRAIECTILIPEEKTPNDDTGERSESTPTQENVGTDKGKRRGKKVLPQVLPETLPKDTAGMVETDRALLGGRQGNAEAGLLELGSDPFVGTGLEGAALDF